MSTSTLVGGSVGNFKDSMNDSVTTLPLAHTKERKDSAFPDSDTLISRRAESPPGRKSPPALRLAPSTAELTGRHRFSAAVDMNRNVPPSPAVTRRPFSPTFGGSEAAESEGALSPRSQLSPTSPTHYAPFPPQLEMPQAAEGFRVSFVSVYDHYKSVTGSMLMASPTATDAASYPSMAMPGLTLNNAGTLDPSPTGSQPVPRRRRKIANSTQVLPPTRLCGSSP
jgi:hypothetical protein